MLFTNLFHSSLCSQIFEDVLVVHFFIEICKENMSLFINFY